MDTCLGGRAISKAIFALLMTMANESTFSREELPKPEEERVFSVSDVELAAVNPQLTRFDEFIFFECRLLYVDATKRRLVAEFADIQSMVTWTNVFVDITFGKEPALALRIFRASRDSPAPTDDRTIRKLPNGHYEWSIELPASLFERKYKLYYGDPSGLKPLQMKAAAGKHD